MPLDSSGTTYFPVSYDLTSKIVSGIVCLMLAVLATATLNVFAKLLGIVIVAMSYGYSPRGYLYSGRALMVRRVLGNANVPLQDLREARLATPEDLQGLFRVWGNGGLFGYYGTFRTSRLGRCRWYVTDRSRMVVVRTGSATMLFSPDDPQAFLAQLTTSLPAGTAQENIPGLDPASLNVEGSSAWKRKLGIALGAILGFAAVSLITLAVRYSPGPVSYTLTADDLSIHDRFYPITVKAAQIDAAHIRIVDWGQEANWRPVTRTNGFANAHYHSGWFRAANGQTALMYWTNSRRVVLLPAQNGGPTVLMEVDDPEKFVNEIQRLWHVVDWGVLRR